MEDEEASRQRPVMHDETPRRRVSLVDASDTLDLIFYGGAAAALVGFGLWLIVSAIWDTGSTIVRSILLGLLALAIAILANDIYSRRFSLLSRLLVGAWAVVVFLLVIAELFSGM